MDLADKVAAALQASVLPSVIARGGEIRVLGVEDGIVTLEIGGSPGASLPLLGRIEQLVRNAVPEIARVRLVGPSGEAQETRSGDLADRVRDILEGDFPAQFFLNGCHRFRSNTTRNNQIEIAEVGFHIQREAV